MLQVDLNDGLLDALDRATRREWRRLRNVRRASGQSSIGQLIEEVWALDALMMAIRHEVALRDRMDAKIRAVVTESRDKGDS